MLAILLDEGLPLRAARLLRDHGVDAVHAREVGLAAAPDPNILSYARNHGRVCATLDHDFHRLLAGTGATTPSVILLRVHKINHAEAAELIARVLQELARPLENGAAVTVTRKGIRFHILPLS